MALDELDVDDPVRSGSASGGPVFLARATEPKFSGYLLSALGRGPDSFRPAWAVGVRSIQAAAALDEDDRLAVRRCLDSPQFSRQGGGRDGTCSGSPGPTPNWRGWPRGNHWPRYSRWSTSGRLWLATRQRRTDESGYRHAARESQRDRRRDPRPGGATVAEVDARLYPLAELASLRMALTASPGGWDDDVTH